MSITVNLNFEYDEDFDREFADQYLPTEEELTKWINYCAEVVGKDASVSVTFLPPAIMQETNNEFRHKDYATNILSFPFELDEVEIGEFDAEEMDFNLLGDLLICPHVVNREAQEQEKTAQDHWTHIVIHGILHLLGYDHIIPDDAQVMEGLEKQILAKVGIADPYRDDQVVMD